MTRKTKLLVSDGGRHRQPTGYGKNARSLITGLAGNSRFDVRVVETTQPWQVDDYFRDQFKQIQSSPETNEADCILQIGTPQTCRKFRSPSIMFTNIDTSSIPPDWMKSLHNTDALLAPNMSNFTLFKKHFPLVYLAQQGIHEHFFKPRPSRRAEGAPVPSFIFVGSYSFRKGTDLLIDSFVREFEPHEAHLTLHLPGDQSDKATNAVFAAMQKCGRAANITVSTKPLSEAWMARIYNQHDAFVTLTRGEGWGLPIVEAMLSGLAVVAPFSSGMKDYLNEDVAKLVRTTPRLIKDIDDPFAMNFRATHGSADNYIEEPDVALARTHMRQITNDLVEAREMGQKARTHILSTFPESKFISSVSSAIEQLLKKESNPTPSITIGNVSLDKEAVGLGLKLEIGAGLNPMPGYIHHDIRSLPDIEVICDARRFPEEHKGRYDEVYAANIIEHFNRFEIEAILAEWISLLRPGGVLKLITPDSREIARQLVGGFITMQWFSYLIYGGQDYEFNKHGFAFDSDSLSELLIKQGLSVVRKKDGIVWEDRKLDKYCPMIQVWGMRRR